MNARPLAGRRIVVTRPRELAGGLASRIRDAGGEAILLPAIEIRDVPDAGAFESVARRLDQFDWAIFISPMAVRKALVLLERIRDGQAWPGALRAAAIGRGSQRALQEAGIPAVVAAGGSDSETLLALPDLAHPQGLRIVIFRGAGGRELLGKTLAERGAVVEYAECYLRARPGPGPESRRIAGGEPVDAVTVSSGEGLANLFAILGESGGERLRETLIIVPHPRVAAQAAALGAKRVKVAGASDAEMLAALVAYFGSESPQHRGD